MIAARIPSPRSTASSPASPTEVSADFGSEADLAPPYPGAKDYYRVPEERLQDLDHLHAFIQRTADVLPLPKKKSPKKKART